MGKGERGLCARDGLPVLVGEEHGHLVRCGAGPDEGDAHPFLRGDGGGGERAGQGRQQRHAFQCKFFQGQLYLS